MNAYIVIRWTLHHAVEIHQEYAKSFPFVSRSSAYKFTIQRLSKAHRVLCLKSSARMKAIIKLPLFRKTPHQISNSTKFVIEFRASRNVPIAIHFWWRLDRKSPKPYPPSLGKLFMETFMEQQNDYEKSRNNSWIIGAHVECDLLRGWLLF